MQDIFLPIYRSEVYAEESWFFIRFFSYVMSEETTRFFAALRMTSCSRLRSNPNADYKLANALLIEVILKSSRFKLDYFFCSGLISRVKSWVTSPLCPSVTETANNALPVKSEGTSHVINPDEESMLMPEGDDLSE